MKTLRDRFDSALRTSSLLIPAPFQCPGCRFHCWDGLCKTCIRSIRRNSEILPSTTQSIEGFIPIVYSFQNTHSLLKHWKENRGSLVDRVLFRLHAKLRVKMKALQFDAIVPIPQSFERSWRRGHESAQTVARYFSKELEVPVLDLLELKNEATPRQASLTQLERESAPNPFQIESSILRRVISSASQNTEMKILLVDDLITSGNTLIRASEELKLFFPHQKIWAGSLGYRPKRSNLFH